VTAAGGRRGLCTDVTASATKHARSRRTQLRQSRAPTPTRVIRRQWRWRARLISSAR